MEALRMTLQETPWWVYVLFIVFVSMGIKSLSDSTMSIKKLFLLPIIFIYWSLSNLSSRQLFTDGPLLKYAIFAVVGAILGYFIYARTLKGYDKANKLFHLRGSPQTLIIFILIFGCKYTFGYLGSSDPDIFSNSDFCWVYLIIEGVISGLYVGRLLHYLFVAARGPFIGEH